MIEIKNLLFFVIYLIFNPNIVRGSLKGLYIPTLIQYGWLKNFKVRTFIDVGAYRGEDSKVINYIFPRAKIYAFEPDKNNLDYISKKLKIKNLKLFSIVVSNRKGIIQFNSHPLSFLSSTLLPEKQKGEFSYFNKRTTKYSVQSDTLDSLLRNEKLKGLVFLKVDTQGSEGLVLKGATKLLKKVDIVHIETPIAKIYKGQTSFDDIYKTLTKNGFKFMGEAKESQFYPQFRLPKSFNSVFIKKSIL